jgi:hypothetical protein
VQGKLVAEVFQGFRPEGEFLQNWNAAGLMPGMYIAQLYDGDGRLIQSGKLMKQ